MRQVLFVASPTPFGGVAEQVISSNPALAPMPIGKRLGDVGAADNIDAREVRDSSGNSENTGSTPTGKPQPVHGILKKPGSF